MPALRFVLLGVPIEIQAPFFVLMGALGLVTHRSPGPLLAWVGIALIAVLAHEAGHAVAFRAFGDRPSITLHGGGGGTTGGDHGVARMIVVTAAGPAAGIGLGLVVALVARLAPPGVATSTLVDDAIFLTIGLSLLNLVPMGGFDGGTILNGLVTLAIGRPAGAAGWMIGALTVLAIVIGALLLARVEIAIFVVIFVIINTSGATSVPALFGAPSGGGTPVGLLNLGRADEALVQAEQASRRDPGNREAVLAYGTALLHVTRYVEAESLFSGLLDREPDDLQALSGRFAARRSLGRLDDAAPDLATLLARAPVGILESAPNSWGCTGTASTSAGSTSSGPSSRAPAYRGRRRFTYGCSRRSGSPSDCQAGRKRPWICSSRLPPRVLTCHGPAPSCRRASPSSDATRKPLPRSTRCRPGRRTIPCVLYARACILAAAGRLAEAADDVERAARGRPALGWIARVDPLLRPLAVAEG